MSSLREKLLKAFHVGAPKSPNMTDRIIDDYVEQQLPILTAVADVVSASQAVLADIEKQMPGWRDELDVPDELVGLEKMIKALEQILNETEER